MLINRKVNKSKQEEEEFGQLLQQQRTINLMKQQKQIASNLQDLAKIEKRASQLDKKARRSNDPQTTEKHDISMSQNDS